MGDRTMTRAAVVLTLLVAAFGLGVWRIIAGGTTVDGTTVTACVLTMTAVALAAPWWEGER